MLKAGFLFIKFNTEARKTLFEDVHELFTVISFLEDKDTIVAESDKVRLTKEYPAARLRLMFEPPVKSIVQEDVRENR
jgi:hypothetical protein